MALAAALAVISVEYALNGWAWLLGRVYPNGWGLGGDTEPVTFGALLSCGARDASSGERAEGGAQGPNDGESGGSRVGRDGDEDGSTAAGEVELPALFKGDVEIGLGERPSEGRHGGGAIDERGVDV